jgi:hypothetical protein
LVKNRFCNTADLEGMSKGEAVAGILKYHFPQHFQKYFYKRKGEMEKWITRKQNMKLAEIY